jgi:hypothetical protein
MACLHSKKRSEIQKVPKQIMLSENVIPVFFLFFTKIFLGQHRSITTAYQFC